MLHVTAWTESVDQALSGIAALADPVLPGASGDFHNVPSGLTKLAAFYAGSASIERARIVAASLRRGILPEVRPLNVGAEPLYPDLLMRRWGNLRRATFSSVTVWGV